MSQVGIFIEGGGGSGSVYTLTGNSGGAVPPDGAGNINIVGSGGVNVSGNIGTDTLTITSSAIGLTWTDENVSFNAVSDNGYFVTGSATALLPSSPLQGDTIIVSVLSAGIVYVQANTGQVIALGNSFSSSGGTASVTTEGGSVLQLVYRSATSTWNTIASVGSWILA